MVIQEKGKRSSELLSLADYFSSKCSEIVQIMKKYFVHLRKETDQITSLVVIITITFTVLSCANFICWNIIVNTIA